MWQIFFLLVSLSETWDIIMVRRCTLHTCFQTFFLKKRLSRRRDLNSQLHCNIRFWRITDSTNYKGSEQNISAIRLVSRVQVLSCRQWMICEGILGYLHTPSVAARKPRASLMPTGSECQAKALSRLLMRWSSNPRHPIHLQMEQCNILQDTPETRDALESGIPVQGRLLLYLMNRSRDRQ